MRDWQLGQSEQAAATEMDGGIVSADVIDTIVLPSRQNSADSLLITARFMVSGDTGLWVWRQSAKSIDTHAYRQDGFDTFAEGLKSNAPVTDEERCITMGKMQSRIADANAAVLAAAGDVPLPSLASRLPGDLDRSSPSNRRGTTGRAPVTDEERCIIMGKMQSRIGDANAAVLAAAGDVPLPSLASRLPGDLDRSSPSNRRGTTGRAPVTDEERCITMGKMQSRIADANAAVLAAAGDVPLPGLASHLPEDLDWQRLNLLVTVAGGRSQHDVRYHLVHVFCTGSLLPSGERLSTEWPHRTARCHPSERNRYPTESIALVTTSVRNCGEVLGTKVLGMLVV
ncbi:hypothetical protein J6590_005907 [Homalodisca vitripennis]|nr:hypothetical protein J6590_005907 [Homalodisca vitripennis]